ncbi:MAG: type II toxin-antitoxin system Phd/YefM family antitoxin [Thermomicrobiales bacterium]
MTRTMSATEARIHFGEVLLDVSERGQTIVVERSGHPQAVIVSVGEYERLKNGAEPPDWWELVERSQQAFVRLDERHPLFDPVEMIRSMREERDEQLLEHLR